MVAPRVLITGATGFVGRHLAQLAAQEGAEVHGLSRRSPGPAEPPALAAHHAADLRDAGAARAAVAAVAPERVFHLAAEASVAESWAAPARTLGDNLRSTHNLLDAVREVAPGARVLLACSGEEYGPVPPERQPIAESEPLRPQNPYAVSKAHADLLGGFYADAHGLAVARLRAFNHVGPGQSASYVVASFARQIAQAERDDPGGPLTVVTGNLSARRDFSDVRDVVRAYWTALDQGIRGAFNVCSGRSVAVADILAALGRLARLTVEQRTDPRLLRPNEVPEIRGSHQQLTDATGWHPVISLEDTLRHTLDWWRWRLADEASP